MNRFPVGRAIAHAYAFLIGRIFTVVALSWLAGILYAGLRFALLRTEPLLRPMDHPDIAAFHLAGALASLLLLSAIAIALTRAALGEPRPWALVHLTIGARELKLFGALIRLGILIAVTAVACVAIVMGAAWGASAAMTQWPALAQTGLPVGRIAHVAAMVLASLVAIHVVLRASFLLFAVAAVEDRASLARAWRLAGGNVFRILAVTLAVAVPVYIAFAACEYALLGPALIEAAHALYTGGSAVPFIALLAGHAGAVSIGGAIMLVVMTALNAGAGASAYAVLTGRAGAEAAIAAEDDAHDDHGHGHDAHGHDPHDAPGNDGHGHDGHGHGAHDDHGHDAHDDHGHDGHGHDVHGHGDGHGEPHEPAHADHGHGAHGHDDQAPDSHGHDAQGHDGHGHDGHGHDGRHHAAAFEPETMELDAPVDHHDPHRADARVLEHA